MNEMEKLLVAEMEDKLEELASFDVESVEYTDAVKNVSEINTMLVEHKKLEQELLVIKNENKWDRVEKVGKIVLEGGIGIAGLIATCHFTKQGFKFEEVGSYSSKTFLNIINKMKFGKR